MVFRNKEKLKSYCAMDEEKNIPTELKKQEIRDDIRADILKHSVDILWREWEYQLERSKEFTVLLTSIAAGITVIAVTNPELSSTSIIFGLIGTSVALAISLFWLRLNHRWASVIQQDTFFLNEQFSDDPIASKHVYLSNDWKSHRSLNMKGSFWWLRGTMGFPILYLLYFASIAIYFTIMLIEIAKGT